MKTLLLTLSLSLVASSANADTKTKTTHTKQVGSKATAILNTKEEDCDDKAKKKVEVKPEVISLSGGDAGCSLDELKKP